VQLLSSSLPRYGFANADTATIYGIEIDGRKNLSFIYNKLSNYYLSGNFTYADSEVVLQKDQEGLYTTNNRQLQGLSQTVVNIALSYEGEGRTVFLSYNKMGERIRKLGLIDDQDEFPDFYEVPPALVDIVWIEQFQNGLSLKTKLGNLLDEETVWYQGSTENVTNRFKNSRTFSFEVSYKY
jgi:outer membrane receptor protein involved in Fe transport